MHCVIIEFQYGDEFDRARVAGIAREARGSFEGMPQLRQKAFTIDEQNRRATNVYLWESEDAARGFFNEELVDRVTGLYGVRPTVAFSEVAELVDNG
jgi:heme-degrading monooxygenase HmoA